MCKTPTFQLNLDEYGGDPNKIVIAGQSAGAHIGACLLLRKSQMEAPTEDETKPSQPQQGHSTSISSSSTTTTTTTWHPMDINGFIAASGPYDLVAMKDILHKNGLDKSIVSIMFCNDVKKYSPTHTVRELLCDVNDNNISATTKTNSNGTTDTDITTLRKRIQMNFPSTCIIHGEIDKTVPFTISLEFFEALKNLNIEQSLEFKLYPSWSHTDPILEAPFAGNHLFHRDVYELVKLWTSSSSSAFDNNNKNENGNNNNNSATTTNGGNDCQQQQPQQQELLPFDENHFACRKICPVFLVQIARFCNPF